MNQWEKCENSVKDTLGTGATPAQLRKAVLSYATSNASDNSIATAYLSKTIVWSWDRLENAGKWICLRSTRTDPHNIDAGIGNALISLSRHYLSATRLKRETDKWRNLQRCHLCWRHVPMSNRSTQKVLCSHHEPRSAKYQKHNRNLNRAIVLYKKSNKINADHPARRPPLSGNMIHKWIEQYYPYTCNYLVSNKIIINDWMNVITQLNKSEYRHDARAKNHEFMTNAQIYTINKNFRDTALVKTHKEMAREPELTLSMLSWCEAWLQATNEDRRGGPRKGAGRPKNN